MELVIIYGPPGSGKFSTARELGRIAGYRVFHNHLTIDPLRAVFDLNSHCYIRLRDRYRKLIVEAAAKAHMKGIVFTYAYGGTKDEDRLLGSLARMVRGRGGKAHFVKLHCSKKELRSRITNSFRRSHGKIASTRALRMEINSRDVFSSVPSSESFEIDNTRVSARRVARMIKAHYGLG